MKAFLLNISLFVCVGCGVGKVMGVDHNLSAEDIAMINRCVEVLKENGSPLIDTNSGHIDLQYQRAKIVRVSAIDSVLLVFGGLDTGKENKNIISDERGVTCRVSSDLRIMSLEAPESPDSRDMVTYVAGDMSVERKEYDHIISEIKKGIDVVMKQRIYEFAETEWIPASEYTSQKMEVPPEIDSENR